MVAKIKMASIAPKSNAEKCCTLVCVTNDNFLQKPRCSFHSQKFRKQLCKFLHFHFTKCHLDVSETTDNWVIYHVGLLLLMKKHCPRPLIFPFEKKFSDISEKLGECVWFLCVS